MAMLSLPLHVITERCAEDERPLAKVPLAKLGLDDDAEDEGDTAIGLYDHTGRPMGKPSPAASKEALFAPKPKDTRLGYAPVMVEIPGRTGMVFSNTDAAVTFMEESGWSEEAVPGQYYLLPITTREELRSLMDFFETEQVLVFALDPVPGASMSLYKVDTLPKMMYLPG